MQERQTRKRAVIARNRTVKKNIVNAEAQVYSVVNYANVYSAKIVSRTNRIRIVTVEVKKIQNSTHCTMWDAMIQKWEKQREPKATNCLTL